MDNSKSNIFAVVTALVAVIIAIGGYFLPPTGFGVFVDGDTNVTNLVADGDITVGDDLTVTDDVTISGGALSIPTTNAATSSTSLGCIQTTATSTATPIRFVIGTSVISTTTPAGNSQGIVAWQYGSCPI